jgi:hypothetical protein
MPTYEEDFVFVFFFEEKRRRKRVNKNDKPVAEEGDRDRRAGLETRGLLRKNGRKKRQFCS